MKERFFQFLKDNNVYYRFNAYFKAQRDITLDFFLGVSKPIYYIANCFTWEKTDEGVDFWRDLNFKWAESISEKKVTLKITNCSKGKTALSLDIITALEQIGYNVTSIKVE